MAQKAYLDQFLTNLATNYSQNDLFIASKALPAVPVKQPTGEFPVFALKDVITRVPNTYRADGATAAYSKYELSSTSYTCVDQALKDYVSKKRKAWAAVPRNLPLTTTEILTKKLMLTREILAAAQLFSASVFSGYTAALSGTDQFDDYDNSTPFLKVDAAKTQVKKNALVKANTIIMGQDVYDTLANHPQVLARIAGGATSKNPAVASIETMARAFNVEQILVGGSVYNSANIGQTVSGSFIWGDSMLVCYIDPSPSDRKLTTGVTLQESKLATRKWYEPETENDWYEVSEMYAPLIVCAGAGYLYTDVLST